MMEPKDVLRCTCGWQVSETCPVVTDPSGAHIVACGIPPKRLCDPLCRVHLMRTLKEQREAS